MRNLTPLLASLLLLLPMLGFAQDASTPSPQTKVVRKIKIRHASPALIFLLLSGKTTPLTPPEPGRPGG